ncbi:MAG: hypothetical protein ACI9Z4_001870 [Polaribacter sp.]|jgi:hypothetical protein
MGNDINYRCEHYIEVSFSCSFGMAALFNSWSYENKAYSQTRIALITTASFLLLP